MSYFKGKVALITGGSRGIGKSCALKLAAEGCNLVINYKSDQKSAEETARQAEKSGVKALTCQADMNKIDNITKLVDFTVKQFGKIDILINSAGISQIVDYSKITEKDWDEMMELNVKGTFFCCQKVMEVMKKQSSGKIVNLASTAGTMGGFIVGVNYSVSKAGVICMTRSLSKVGIKHGININCVAPGLIDTDMTTAYPKETVESMKGGIPIGRLGSADEVADGIVFLASDKASYIVGTTLYINGGTYLG
jgi:3-oxoacyl-[acyl-carrier protein] reductase